MLKKIMLIVWRRKKVSLRMMQGRLLLFFSRKTASAMKEPIAQKRKKLALHASRSAAKPEFRQYTGNEVIHFFNSTGPVTTDWVCCTN
jgi:hypothetical protein